MLPKLWVFALTAGLEASACGTHDQPDPGISQRVDRSTTIGIIAPETVQAPAAGPPVARTSEPEPPPRPQEPAAQARTEPSAPTAEQLSALTLLREERIFGSPIEHFTISNEYRHDLWFPYLRGLGGAYVGVASDQNYTLIAAARSEYAFLVDLDREVVDLHGIYAALIAVADSPEAFLALFDDSASARRTARQTILAALVGLSPSDRSRSVASFEAHREALAEYLRKVKTQTGSWLADADAYSYVRTMFATGRIRVLQGNLMGRATMASIAESAKALGVAVKVLYLSNAEEYLFYGDRFAGNVRALPAAEDSVVLRTIHDRFPGWESCGGGDQRWNYQVHSLADFQRRLGERTRSKNRDRTTMLADALAEGAVQRVAKGVSVIAPKPPVKNSGGDLPAPQASAAQ